MKAVKATTAEAYSVPASCGWEGEIADKMLSQAEKSNQRGSRENIGHPDNRA